MNGSPGAEIVDTLNALQTANRKVYGVCLTSIDGRLLGSTPLKGMEKVQLSGISAASLAIARKGIKDLQLGDLDQVHIMGEKGAILLLDVDMKAVLTVIASDTVGLEVIVQEARKVTRHLATLV